MSAARRAGTSARVAAIAWLAANVALASACSGSEGAPAGPRDGGEGARDAGGGTADAGGGAMDAGGRDGGPSAMDGGRDAAVRLDGAGSDGGGGDGGSAGDAGDVDAGEDAGSDAGLPCDPQPYPIAMPGDDIGGDTYATWAAGFFMTWCTRCHSSSLVTMEERMGAPLTVNFDTEMGVRVVLSNIRYFVGVSEMMPANPPLPSCDERLRLLRWIDVGAP